MKAQILKIAGVKSEKEFYKKYPSEEAFMKQHGKAFKKAQVGAVISGGGRSSNPKMLGLKDFYDDADLTVTGMTDDMRQKQAADMAAQAAAAKAAGSQSSGGGGGGLGSILGMLGGGEGGEGGLMSMFGGSGGGGGEGAAGAASMLGGARYGANIPQAASGTNMNNWWANINTNTTTNTTTLALGVDSNEYGSFPPPVDSSLEGSPGYKEQQSNTASQIPSNVPEKSGFQNTMSSIAKVAGPVGEIYEGFQALKAEKAARKAAEQEKVVSDITLKASQTRPEEIKRKYVRPEDIENTGEEFFPIYGVGTNVLARNGMRLQGGGMIGGNPTEIQNTYGDGNSIYDDLGYEPLTDYNQQKSFRHGGYIPRMQGGGQTGFQNWQNSMSGGGSGFSGAGASGGTPWGAIGSQATGIGQSAMGGQNAGGKIGGTVGKSVGSIFGPAGGAIGEFVGGIAGNALDTNAKRMKKAQSQTKRNITNMGLSSGFQSVNAGYSSYVRDGGDIPSYEEGGYMNPEYNPQVITMFGDVDDQDFADFAHKDEFRAGGHLKAYTPPSARAMETYEYGGDIKSFGLGGELETHWGGGAETMSYNPYLPGSGETVMFRGKSHEEYSPNGETGIGVTYGGNPVEVERGEPMVELEEGGVIDPETGEVQKSGVVFGNLQIPNQYIDLLGDKNAKGKKFKNYVADLSKTEAKQNKIVEKSTNELNALDVTSSFDRLKLASLEASINGANMKLKDLADKKINAASLQNAINDTAEENKLVADDLAKGKVKIDKNAMKEQAKFGASIPKAQGGYKIKGTGDRWSYTKAGETGNPLWDDMQRYDNEWTTSVNEALTDKERGKRILNYIDVYSGEGSDNIKKALNKINTEEGKLALLQHQATNKEVGPMHKIVDAAIKYTARKSNDPKERKNTPAKDTDASFETVPYKRSGLLDFAGQLLPYIRPTDQEAFDMAQLYPEMYALSSNQLEPVPTQGYQPDLGVPYDISLQDQLNANQSDYRAAQRIAGYNPAAQANSNAQKYQANQEILGTQFRANQAMKDKVYGENRNILNQAKLTNLGIYDKQYERQAEALSNTKATTQAALNSISDKYAKNALENKTLGIYENLYNYRYDNRGRAINMNAPFQANIPYIYGNDGKPTHKIIYAKDKKTIIGYQPVSKQQAIEIPSGATPAINPDTNMVSEEYSPIDENDIMYQERNGGKTKKKKYSQGSIVRAFK